MRVLQREDSGREECAIHVRDLQCCRSEMDGTHSVWIQQEDHWVAVKGNFIFTNIYIKLETFKQKLGLERHLEEIL